MWAISKQRPTHWGSVRSSSASISKGGHHFLNFSGADFTVVCFKENAAKFKDGGPAKTFDRKEVQVTGKIELFKGKPQIKLTLPGQISLLDDKSSTPSTPDDDHAGTDKATKLEFKLKQVAANTWLSPAGLRYEGKDPQGLTRVEHVLRHAANQPTRAGSHGVFDGGKDQALATIDEAWRLAKQQKIEPKQEGQTSAYTIPMGRRVGYLGGQAGTTRGNPPLKNVFIVVRTGTSNVITAFPR